MLIALTAKRSLVKALQFLKDVRFYFVTPTLIIHQRMPADTSPLRSLTDSQPGTQSHDPQPLTVG